MGEQKKARMAKEKWFRDGKRSHQKKKRKLKIEQEFLLLAGPSKGWNRKKRKKKIKKHKFVPSTSARNGHESYETWNRRQKTGVTSEELSPVTTITQVAGYIIEEINLDIDCEHTEELKGATEPRITLEDLYNGF